MKTQAFELEGENVAWAGTLTSASDRTLFFFFTVCVRASRQAKELTGAGVRMNGLEVEASLRSVLHSISSYILCRISVISFSFSILPSYQFGSSPWHLSPFYHNSLPTGLSAFRIASSNPFCI